MIKLLKLEYSKFKKSQVVVLLLALFVVFLPFTVSIGEFFKELPPPMPSHKVFTNFPEIWDYLGYSGNWMVSFLFGVLIIYTITLEVSYKTLRQSLIIGMTRRSYYLSKLYVVITLSVFATIFYTLVTLIVGFINTPNPTMELAFTNDWAIPRFFLMCLGYLTFAMMIAFLVRNSALSVFVYLAVLYFIEPLVRLAHRKWIGTDFLNYYPMNSIEDLMPNPLYRIADYVKINDSSFLMPYETAAALTVLYIAIFVAISYRSFLKRDL
jgi:hypothetical protein